MAAEGYLGLWVRFYGVDLQFVNNGFKHGFEAMGSGIDGVGRFDGTFRVDGLRLAHRIKAAGIARNCFAAFGIEWIGLQRPGDVMDLLCRFQHHMLRRGIAIAGCSLTRHEGLARFSEMLLERFNFGFELPEECRRLAQRRLQAADGIFKHGTIKTPGAAAVLGEKPASARRFQQGGFDRAIFAFAIVSCDS